MSQYDVTAVTLTPAARTRAAVDALVDGLQRRGEDLTLVTQGMSLDAAALVLQVLQDDLGYAVVPRLSADGGVLLWAERGHEVLAALTHEDGRVEIDQAGAQGGACLDRVHDLRVAAEARGLVFGEGRPLAHGDPRGGSLIRRAGRPQPVVPTVGSAATRLRLGGGQ